MQDFGKIIRRVGINLDIRWLGYNNYQEPATRKQVLFIAIAFREIAEMAHLKGDDADWARHRFTQEILGLQRPASAKTFTKGQASALIALLKHREYKPQLTTYLLRTVVALQETA